MNPRACPEGWTDWSEIHKVTQVEDYFGQVAWTAINPCCLQMCGSESSAGT